MVQGRLAPLLGVLLACGRSGSGTPPPPPREEAAVTATEDASDASAPLALGLTDVQRYAYRGRDGQPAFRRARAHEAAGDWPAVATACREALAADPDHLDAAYLLAIALAKSDAAPRAILAPLTTAVAGDFGARGHAALEHPAFAPVLATAAGTAWRARVVDARRAFTAALARSLLVTADGEIFAYDVQTANPRWYRLTRSHGSIHAAFRVRATDRLAFITRAIESRHAGATATVRVGLVDLATGRMRSPVKLPGSPLTVRVAHHRTLGRFVVRAGKAWFAIEDSAATLELRPVPTKQAGNVRLFTEMAWLDVTGHRGQLERRLHPGLTADWDEHRLASAIKLESTKRVIVVPSPGLIDGNTATWSPDGSQLAFVARITEDCVPEQRTSGAFVADAATGRVKELETASDGNAVEWLADRTLAVSGQFGVSIHETLDGPRVDVAGADALVTPRRRPGCPPDWQGKPPHELLIEEMEIAPFE